MISFFAHFSRQFHLCLTVIQQTISRVIGIVQISHNLVNASQQHHQQHFHAALKYFKHFIIHSDRTFVDRSIGTVLFAFAFPIHI